MAVKTGCEHVSDEGLHMFMRNLKRNVWRVALMPNGVWNQTGAKGEMSPAESALMSAGMREMFEAEARKRGLEAWDIDDPDDPAVADLVELFDV
jgi:hypothetical protein